MVTDRRGHTRDIGRLVSVARSLESRTMAEGDDLSAGESRQDACNINNGTINNYYGHDRHDRDHDHRRPRRPHLRRLAVVAVAGTSLLSVSAVGLSAVGHGTATNPTPAPTPAPITQPVQPAPAPQPTIPVGNPHRLASFQETTGVTFQPQMQPDGTMQLTASKTDVARDGDANVSFRIRESNGNVPAIINESGNQSSVSCTGGCTGVLDPQGKVIQAGDVPNGARVDFILNWRPSHHGHAQLQVQANGNPKWECIGNIYEGRSGPGA